MRERTARDVIARARRQGRIANILISEIGHDLDEIATGWSQKEDALIKVGLGDAYRELEELDTVVAALEMRQEELEGAVCVSALEYMFSMSG